MSEQQRETVGRAVEQIANQATTGTAITPLPEDWVRALPRLDVACKWTMEGTLTPSYLWHEDGDYFATDLPPGLEDREGTPLSEHAAAALLESGLSHKPVDVEEVPA